MMIVIQVHLYQLNIEATMAYVMMVPQIMVIIILIVLHHYLEIELLTMKLNYGAERELQVIKKKFGINNYLIAQITSSLYNAVDQHSVWQRTVSLPED